MAVAISAAHQAGITHRDLKPSNVMVTADGRVKVLDAIYGFNGAGSPREFAPRGKEAALRALRIDDTLAEAHTALGVIKHVYHWDWSGAEREHKRAIELNPHDASSYMRYAAYFEGIGRMDAAIAENKRAQELEPLSLIISAVMGRILYHARQYDRAVDELGKSPTQRTRSDGSSKDPKYRLFKENHQSLSAPAR